MTSCDTNVLFAALDPQNQEHGRALSCLDQFRGSRDFVLCEQVLMETYVLLRNPAAHPTPLNAQEAAALISRIRDGGNWIVVDVPQDRSIMDETWRIAAQPGFARRRIYDVRLARTLRHWGVDTFYTRNVGDFQDAGFAKLVNPFE